MADDDRPQLVDLICRHRGLLALLSPAPGDDFRPEGQGSDQFSAEEYRLRASIVAWPPRNASEAREKLKHLAGFVAATGVGFDVETLEAILRSVEGFFAE